MESNQKFYYFLCNEGSEAFLKEEVKLFHPELRFSFSQKGFVTFKLVGAKIKNAEFVFCRHFGEFVQKGNKETLEQFIPAEAKSVEYALNGEIKKNIEINLNDEVFELIELKPNEYYLGKYIVKKATDRLIGGFAQIVLPTESPSRAYLKILEGSKKVGINFSSDQNALEVGSSPGGATYALLKQGLNVMGVDPGEMDPICHQFSNFKHHKMAIQDFKVDLIDKKIDWFLCDMNLAPEATLNEIEKILIHIKDDFKGGFITLKMTKLSLVARLPFYKKIMERMGVVPELMTQLPSHKQEFLMFIRPKNFSV